MSVGTIEAAQMRCDRKVGEAPRCTSEVMGSDPTLAEDEVRKAAAERGWGRGPVDPSAAEPVEGDVCPRHRG